MLNAGCISVSLRGREILRNVSVSILPGRFTAIVGPNGAGKSTLLRALSGESPASVGQVTINGKQIGLLRADALSLVRSVMAQDTRVQFAFSVEQVVLLGRQAHAATRTQNEAVINEVMELTGVTPLRRRIYQTLSGGEKQRVQLTRVLAQVWEQAEFPRYLLLDEPTSSLDMAQQQIIFSLAKSACSRNIGVLAIVHDLNQAAQYADEMLFLKSGKCVASGETATVFNKPIIEETFGCPVTLHRIDGREHPLMIPEFGTEAPVAILEVSNQSGKR